MIEVDRIIFGVRPSTPKTLKFADPRAKVQKLLLIFRFIEQQSKSELDKMPFTRELCVVAETNSINDLSFSELASEYVDSVVLPQD
jgi:hypothetical protein